MNLIEITDKNKYEIVSKLREFKHKISNTSNEEFDIFLPLIKSYIFSIDALKTIFLEKIAEYNNILASQEFKNQYKAFLEYWEKNDNNIYNVLDFIFDYFIVDGVLVVDDFQKDYNSFDNESKIRYEKCDMTGLLIKMHLVEVNRFGDANSNNEDKLKKDLRNIIRCFGDTIDFKIISIEEALNFSTKKVNFLKLATFNVLEHLEYFLFNNLERANALSEKSMKINRDRLPKRLENKHLEFMKLRKGLDVNTYKEIAKKMDGKYTESSLKSLAKEINDTLGTNNIDTAIRIFEKEYGEL